MAFKKIFAVLIALLFFCFAGVATIFIVMSSDLPQLITVEDYAPKLVSEVFDRKGQKIGEFSTEKRILVPYEKIPPQLIQAFVAAEDSSFFTHSGLNFVAIFRAFLANLKAGRRVQGASTITQQVARSLLLSSEKTYTRKIKEAILAFKMESNLSKEEILYLYLNQIYLGQSAYGVGAAAEIYFRKPIEELELKEMALIAGLPQSPSRYSPIRNPSAAKERQRYVLRRMADEGFITSEQAQEAMGEPVGVYVTLKYAELAPYYTETIRQMLVKKLGQEMVLNQGLKIYSSLDKDLQLQAQREVQKGLRVVDKRQGYRGPIKNITEAEEVADFLLKTRNELSESHSPLRVIQPDGTIIKPGPLNLTEKNEDGEDLPNLPDFIEIDQIVPAIVTKVSDEYGLVMVRFAESKGIIDFDSMKWARKPDPKKRAQFDEIDKPSLALKKGDVIEVRVIGEKFSSSRVRKQLAELQEKMKDKYKRPDDVPEFDRWAHVELEQEPQLEGALVSIDQNTSDILAMVGGYDFKRSEFNRAIQAARQTGSAFKAIAYAAALDKSYTPSTMVLDAPIVFEEGQEGEEDSADEMDVKKWKPSNHGQNFQGEILFRNALIRSLNIPTIKITEKIGVQFIADYARRLGIFSPLNMDFTLSLGSSGVTLYEMTKVFAQFGLLGQKLSPLFIHKVESSTGEVLIEKLSLDERFRDEIGPIEERFEEKRLAYLEQRSKLEAELAEQEANPDQTEKKTLKESPFYFDDPNQLISPSTAYLITSILQGAVEEPGGTGGAARALGRPVAGKTGSTNGYYDGWFIGYTPDVASGVWVGFDQEKSIGAGEVGGRVALPIWLEVMKMAHEGLPIRNFTVPDGIVFANIDNKTGQLASSASSEVVRQAFRDGTEPGSEETIESRTLEEKNFLKEDLFE